MTTERVKAINDWLNIHCHKCENNIDIGTGYVNCDAECEVKKRYRYRLHPLSTGIR